MTSYRVLCVQSSCTWVCVFAVIWQWWFSAGLLRAAQIHPAQRVSCGVAVLCRQGEQQPAPVSVSASLHAYEKVWKWKRWESLQIFIFPMVLFVRRKSYLWLQHYFKTSHWTWSWPEQTLLQASCGKPYWQKHLHSVEKKRKAAIKMIFTAFALFL